MDAAKSAFPSLRGMKSVILISAPYRDLYGPIKAAAGYYFPLGLGYIASVLIKHGYDVRLCEPDAQRMGYEDIERMLAHERPDIVGIGSATPNFHNAVEIARLAKAHGAVVVLGGIHASSLPSHIAGQYGEFFDYVVCGEGEFSILELVRELEAGRVPLNVKGLSFLHEGRVITTPLRPHIENLDSLPYPARELLPQDIFRPNLHNQRYKRCFTILTSRGCPFRCSFCASRKALGSIYRTHSADYVLGEMEYLKKLYGAEQLVITDDTFTLDRNRLIAICEGMIRHNLNLKWFCFSQVTAVDKDILKLMKRAGCYNIGFGVESASLRILSLMKKPIRPEKCAEVIAAASGLGIKTQAFFVLGIEESLEELRQTVDFAVRLKPTFSFFNMLVPYPGTEEFERFFADVPLSSMDWKDFVAVGVNAVVRNSNFNLRKEIFRANMRFYARPSQLFRIARHIRTRLEFWNHLKGGLALLRQMRLWRRA
ncbi:MAG: radical SAM protein [Thermodesulfovibrionales bacterium]|nr:radical SAM protein [Thermodesulfovibrionales bacterium]